MRIIEKIKVAARNDLREQVLELKNSGGSIGYIRQGLINLIDNTSHLTTNKIGVRVEFDRDGKVVIFPINLASAIFIEDGILLKEPLPVIGSVSVNDKEYFFETPIKHGIYSERIKKKGTSKHVKIVGCKDLYELQSLFHQKIYYPYERSFWVKNIRTGKLIVEQEKNIIR